ncbi:MAG: sugar phosphate nucleotidyltransferase [Myxococcota bacterium]|nr:sugar phosphate nucleotidyltransferase [Myxococcota bacterium]
MQRPIRKGVLLAGGHGSRLFPLTVSVNKHLLPVHDKPMVFYPLSTLMLAGLRDLLIVSTPAHVPAFEQLLGDGDRFGVRIAYATQPSARGVADGLLAAEPFLDGEGCALALGDNLFWGYLDFLRAALARSEGATAFAYPVQDASGYGIVELDDAGRPVGIEEKPSHPRSQLAVPGLYVLDGEAVSFARAAQKSPRGELEIADVLRAYLQKGRLRVARLGRGMAWLDMGTPEGLLGASEFVATIQRRQGLYVGCLEEVALHMGWRTRDQLRTVLAAWPAGPYRAYVEALLHE